MKRFLLALCFAALALTAEELPVGDFRMLESKAVTGTVRLLSDVPERYELALNLSRDGVRVEVVNRRRPQSGNFRLAEGTPETIAFGRPFTDFAAVVRDLEGNGDYAGVQLEITLGENVLTLPVAPAEPAAACVAANVVYYGGDSFAVYNLSMGTAPISAPEADPDLDSDEPEAAPADLPPGESCEWPEAGKADLIRFELGDPSGSPLRLAVLLRRTPEDDFFTFVAGSAATRGLSSPDARTILFDPSAPFHDLYVTVTAPAGYAISPDAGLSLTASPLDPAAARAIVLKAEPGASMIIAARLEAGKARLVLTALNQSADR